MAHGGDLCSQRRLNSNLKTVDVNGSVNAYLSRHVEYRFQLRRDTEQVKQLKMEGEKD